MSGRGWLGQRLAIGARGYPCCASRRPGCRFAPGMEASQAQGGLPQPSKLTPGEYGGMLARSCWDSPPPLDQRIDRVAVAEPAEELLVDRHGERRHRTCAWQRAAPCSGSPWMQKRERQKVSDRERGPCSLHGPPGRPTLLAPARPPSRRTRAGGSSGRRRHPARSPSRASSRAAPDHDRHRHLGRVLQPEAAGPGALARQGGAKDSTVSRTRVRGFSNGTPFHCWTTHRQEEEPTPRAEDGRRCLHRRRAGRGSPAARVKTPTTPVPSRIRCGSRVRRRE